MTDGLGIITWWGFSPAIDLQEKGILETVEKLSLKEESYPDEVNMLLVGAGDIRHVLKTVAQRGRHKRRKINFYVVETALELYARDMLFMAIALEPQSRMGLQEKMELVLELYGNILVRNQSVHYVQKMAILFIKMVTDSDYLKDKLPLVDLSQLKFKERDFLENIFKMWRSPEKPVFDAEKCWDLRLRQYLGTRYDYRMNAFDWDYHMKLCERGGDIIRKFEYQRWRNTGVAFEIREGTYDVPNKTLASLRIFNQSGEHHARRGFWGDVVIGPFITMGLETTKKSFYKKQNDIYVKTAEDISGFNVISMFHEIATGHEYELPKVVEDSEPGAKLTEITEENEQEDEGNKQENDKEGDSNKEKKEKEPEKKNEENGVKEQVSSEDNIPTAPLDLEYEPLPVDDVKIIFLPVACLQDIVKKKKYEKLFHLVYFSNSMVHHLKPEITAMFANQSTVILETVRFMLDLKPEQLEEFVKKTKDLAEAAGCKVLEECNGKTDNFSTFVYQMNAAS
ncbi:dynein assembly factor 3, axonemal-like [Gigantopelta aegis]|uniref:dynein assembly factor 3, axonemal-like n=1 Tax=Gigantopelta aegis TaxID=1735272 RepID=UPI001B88AF22|nr:dynein assembly factor 3, axonemal-like [Gigantopelta aegis]